jgi:hypothetical protein
VIKPILLKRIKLNKKRYNRKNQGVKEKIPSCGGCVG